MFEIGRINRLKVVRLDGEGAWLQAAQEEILLPKREVPAGTKLGDELSLFVYRKPSGPLLATIKRPKAQVGEFVLLQVSQVSQPGAFLDWGLEKDLLVPYAEQPDRMREGRRYLVKICRDSGGRVVGTARIERCLESEQIELQEGQAVDLIIWKFTDLGAKVIIDNLYEGLLYRDELGSGLQRGDRLKGYVKRVRADRKVDVTLRRSGSEGVEAAKATILATLESAGFLPLNDQSSPEEIQQLLGMSKKLFKKAVGGLYKAGTVELIEAGIRLKK